MQSTTASTHPAPAAPQGIVLHARKRKAPAQKAVPTQKVAHVLAPTERYVARVLGRRFVTDSLTDLRAIMTFVIKHNLSFLKLKRVCTLFFHKSLERMDQVYARCHDNEPLRVKMHNVIVDLVTLFQKASGSQRDETDPGYWSCDVAQMSDEDIKRAVAKVARFRQLEPEPAPLTSGERLLEVQRMLRETTARLQQTNERLAELSVELSPENRHLAYPSDSDSDSDSD